MTPAQEAAEVLAAARSRPARPPARATRRSPAAQPAAVVQRCTTPSSAAALLRAFRLPLDAHQLRRLERLEQLAGDRYLGWGHDQAGRTFVDVRAPGGDEIIRYLGDSLHEALGCALRVTGGRA